MIHTCLELRLEASMSVMKCPLEKSGSKVPYNQAGTLLRKLLFTAIPQAQFVLLQKQEQLLFSKT